MGKTTNNRNAKKVGRTAFSTHDGHGLTPREAKFINEYIKTGVASESVVAAGYVSKNPSRYALELLRKPYINNEINYRLEQAKTEAIADATEVMQYLTSVMRGEVKDQFGLDAPLSERTKAAQELAKRTIDVETRMKTSKYAHENNITITLVRRGEEKC